MAAASDERCYETATEGVACWVGALKAGASISFPIAVRFPDCPPAPTTITFSHAVQDQGTSDPFPAGYSATVPLDPAASCP